MQNSSTTFISNMNKNILSQTRESLMMNSIKAQPQQLRHKQSFAISKNNCVQQQQQTIIGKVFKQEVSMAQQALTQTHMTSKEFLGYSNIVTDTSAARQTTKRINKQKFVQQQKLYQLTQNGSDNSNNKALSKIYANEQLKSKITDTSDPAAIVANMYTTYSSLPPPAALISSAIEIVENSQCKIQQCVNVCIHSKCSSKQKCIYQQEQQTLEPPEQHHCKSANISNNHTNKNNFINIRTSSNKKTTEMITATTHTNTNNTTSSTTTNKANISSSITSTLHRATDKPTTLETSSSSAAAAAAHATATTYCQAFPLRRFYHTTKQLECLLRTVVFSCMFIMSMQYQTVSASSSMMSKHEPMFISRSETFKFVAGDTIVLPCEVANTDPYVVAWKRGIAILTAGSVKVTPDPRVRLVNGFNLQIRDAVPQDAGDYICQIATMEPREITHTVEILVPPRIHHISTSGHLQVKKGSSVRIECSASGNPTPNVTWSRKNNILPNGEEKLHSHILSIENVDRHKGGVYICTANNGVGQPASSQVVLHVLYPPEITVERPVVFSGEGHEAMLVCIVHGETQPEVIWFKDTMQLDTTERHIMENRGSRHTLIIRKVHPQDFGNYSCVAENQLGKSRKTLQLSGKPNVAVFNSPPISQYKDRYNISWTVESHTPIEEYKLSFRRLQQGQEVDNSIDSQSSASSMVQMYGSSGGSSSSMMGANVHNYRLGGVSSMGSMGNMAGGGYGSYGAINNKHWIHNEWRDVVLPAIPTSHHYTQGMSYMIRGLDPDQHYEATVQARNRYGWSDYSQGFVFSTSSNDNEMRDLSVTFYGSRSIRLETKGYLFVLILTVITYLLHLPN